MTKECCEKEFQAIYSGKCCTGIVDGPWEVQVLSSPFALVIHTHPSIYRHFQEHSPLILLHLTRVLASHRNKASTKHPGSDPSRVTEVLIYLTDFILKYRCSCLLQLPSSAPIWLGNKFEVRSGQKKKKILLTEM